MEAAVVIIGAGPTGLMAACQLGRFGVNCIVIDSKAGPTLQSRALLVTSRSLEIYDQMGIAEQAVEQGTQIAAFSIFTQGQERLTFPIGIIGQGLTDFPYMHVFEQSKNEQLLNDFLTREGNSVWWNTAFIGLEQDLDGVSVHLVKQGAQEQALTIRAKYVIGCDGAGSKVRQILNCKFEGGTYKHKFFIADVRMKWDQVPGKVVLSLGRSKFCAFFPMQGENNYRVLGTLSKANEGREDLGFSDLESGVQAAMGLPLKFEQLNWFSTYRLHHRCVNHFKVGRCFLAGDAAHIHSPAGGQGMNTGLQDAYNLTWKLATVIRGQATNRLLETYHSERYPFARWLLKFTDRAFSMISSRNLFIGWFRVLLGPLLLRRFMSSQSRRKKMFQTISQIWYAYSGSSLSVTYSAQELKFKAGDRFPYVLTPLNGQMQSCYHLFREPKFHLLIIANQVKENLNLIPKRLESLIKIVYLPFSSGWESLGVEKDLYILVRPDNYIGMLADQLDEEMVLQYFNRL